MQKKKEEDYMLRKLFLKNFVSHLIGNSYIAPPKEEMLEAVQEEISHQPQIKKAVQPTLSLKPLIKPIARQIPPMRPQMPLPMPMHPPVPIRPPPLTPVSPGHVPGSISFGRITSILLDPTVFSIECPGPGKSLLVNKAGAIQSTSMTLVKEEIDNVMEEISQQTRIPINPGLFRAAVQDLLITAVVSEYVGTRFIIQKRTPF